MTPYRARLFRIVLGAAAAYNVAFGLWAGFMPRAFFEWMELEAPRYPAIWQCLGMVVGVYGAAYAYAARHLDRARPFVAIGLLGKVLGPIGWLATVGSGEWPVRTFTLVLFNDLVWWLPFSLIVLEGTRVADRLRAWAPWACSIFNAAAGVATVLALAPGTEAAGALPERIAYVTRHPGLWRGGWLTWNAAALSLVAFYAWWGARLARPGWGVAAFAVAVLGLIFDLFFESLLIGWLPRDFEGVSGAAFWTMAVVANGGYSAAGAILTLGARSPAGLGRAWAWANWAAGFALCAAAIAGSVTGQVVATAAMLALFCPWPAIFGRRLG